MSGGLIHHDDGPPVARCVRCSAVAAGPCARCQSPVCGDCCVLTEGGARVWAICLACEDRGGRSLRRGWITFLGWIAVPIAGLAVLVALLEWLARK
ncbi:hypothetical protein [Polyangium jinanense]|uniref:Uncharacterized protein n=1 Tax=Polyangium jinanense TaxID=2829994 RepID=A0A9X3X9M0_9BACT|nr:hypothetical protein [Polyangium jinanense]MDC3959813.1 hypothetical protein [Polyangium jinanense]MDC3986264.1 hypothetical protein [Polyangium jinanense]